MQLCCVNRVPKINLRRAYRVNVTVDNLQTMSRKENKNKNKNKIRLETFVLRDRCCSYIAKLVWLHRIAENYLAFGSTRKLLQKICFSNFYVYVYFYDLEKWL